MIVKTVSYTDRAAPEKLTESLRKTGFAVLNNHPISKSLINETYKQWENFFNLETKNQYLYDKDTQDGFFPFGTENAKGNKIIVISQLAFSSLTTNQKEILSSESKILNIPIPIIQKCGGGSVRCMIAELI